MREQRLAAEISAAKRERDFYLRCPAGGGGQGRLGLQSSFGPIFTELQDAKAGEGALPLQKARQRDLCTVRRGICIQLAACPTARLHACSRVDKAKAVSAMLERKRKRSVDGDEGARGAQGGEAAHGQQPTEGGAQRAPAVHGSSCEARPTKQAKQQPVQQAAQEQQDEQQQRGGAAGGVRVLRTYGQRRAKADPATDAAAPVLSSGLLKLIAGKKGKAGGGSAGGSSGGAGNG